MDFILGIVTGAILYMIYNNTIQFKGEKNHWVIDIHKEDDHENKEEEAEV